MQDRAYNTVGGTCAILLGIVTATTAITYILLPPEQRAAVPAPQILPSVAQNSTLLLLELWQTVIYSILGLVVVPTFARLAQPENEVWVRWTSNLALVGFAVTAVSSALSAARLPGIATAYVNGDASTKATLAPIWRSTLDVQGLWQFGAVGVWIIAISYLALRGNAFPTYLVYAGFALGIAHLLISPGLVTKTQAFILVAAGLSAILGPIWYIWTGLILRRRE